MQDQVAVAVAAAVAVADLTKRFFNHIQKDFLMFGVKFTLNVLLFRWPKPIGFPNSQNDTLIF